MSEPSRSLGVFDFANNFEVTLAAPLDARMVTPTKASLTNGSIPALYLGMLVCVTSDTTNNGLYRLTDVANKTWELVGASHDKHPKITANARLDANLIHDGSVSNTEFGYLKDVSSDIQTQLDAKQPEITATARLDANLIHDGTVSNTKFGYLNGVTDDIQDQLDAKQPEITATARLNANLIHDGSVSNTEFGYLKDVSSDIQTQLDAKQPEITATARLNANLIHDGSVSNTEFGYLKDVSSDIQDQLDAKHPKIYTPAQTGDTPYAVGNIPAGTNFHEEANKKTIDEVLDMLLFAEVDPVIRQPACDITLSNVTSAPQGTLVTSLGGGDFLVEHGSNITFSVAVSFIQNNNRVVLSGDTQAQPYSGNITAVKLTADDDSFATRTYLNTEFNSYNSVSTVTGQQQNAFPEKAIKYKIAVTWANGSHQPVTSYGNNFGVKFSSAEKTSEDFIQGVNRILRGTSASSTAFETNLPVSGTFPNLTEGGAKLYAYGTEDIKFFLNYKETNAVRHRIAVPKNHLTDGVDAWKLEFYDPSSGKYLEDTSWEDTDAQFPNAAGVNQSYTLFTKQGPKSTRQVYNLKKR